MKMAVYIAKHLQPNDFDSPLAQCGDLLKKNGRNVSVIDRVLRKL